MEDKTRLCRSWNANRSCKFGNRCNFFHLSNRLIGDDKSVDEKKLCRHWNKNGKCLHDERCKFLHPPLCKHWNGDKGSCRKNENCRYFHSEEVEDSETETDSGS